MTSLALVVVNSFVWSCDRIRARRASAKCRRKVQERVESLDAAECAVLREFYLREQRTLGLPINFPAVAGLIRAGILQQEQSVGTRIINGMVFPVRISDDADKFISRKLLFGNFIIVSDGEATLTDEGNKWAANNRPEFIDDPIWS